jgi:NAD(P)-dependent dehydrogenase (short-subunit alcohol dehydrogenase family)
MTTTKSVATVTGASRGIGRATALRLARDFSVVVLPAYDLTVEEAVRRFPQEAGITRFGKPEEIADLMSYLVSPAKWMTGASVRMDGGEISAFRAWTGSKQWSVVRFWVA